MTNIKPNSSNIDCNVDFKSHTFCLWQLPWDPFDVVKSLFTYFQRTTLSFLRWTVRVFVKKKIKKWLEKFLSYVFLKTLLLFNKTIKSLPKVWWESLSEKCLTDIFLLNFFGKSWSSSKFCDMKLVKGSSETNENVTNKLSYEWITSRKFFHVTYINHK